MAHAKFFGPSSLHRRIDCPASAMLEKDMPDSEGMAARTGSAAHALAEYCWETGEHTRMHVHTPAPHPYTDIPVTPEMCEAVQMYLNEIAAIDAETKLIEESVSYADFVLRHAPAVASGMGKDAIDLVKSDYFREQITADCFGTADFTGIDPTNGILYGRDYKNGITPVYADDNSQLQAYALATLETFWWMGEFETVDIGIVQPHAGIRDPDHPLIDVVQFPVDELLVWGKTKLIPAIIKAMLPEPTYGPTDHACLFCKAKGVCRARADEAQALAVIEFDAFDVAEPELPAPALLTIEEMGQALQWEERMVKWFKDVRSHASHLATEEGIEIPGQKVVRGTKLATWTDEGKADNAFMRAGVKADERRTPWKLRSVAQMTKELGSDHPVIQKFSFRPESELKLVAASAKGAAVTVKPKAERIAEEFDALELLEA